MAEGKIRPGWSIYISHPQMKCTQWPYFQQPGGIPRTRILAELTTDSVFLSAPVHPLIDEGEASLGSRISAGLSV